MDRRRSPAMRRPPGSEWGGKAVGTEEGEEMGMGGLVDHKTLPMALSSIWKRNVKKKREGVLTL